MTQQITAPLREDVRLLGNLLGETLKQHAGQDLFNQVEQIRALADEALVTVQAALDPAIFAAAFETGRQLSLAEAFATILAPDHSVPTTLTTSFAK